MKNYRPHDSIERSSLTDDLLDAMSHVQRRALLVALLDHNPQNDSPVVVTGSAGDRDQVERLVEMKHTHLPKLEEYGFVEWNRDTHEVVRGPKFEGIKPLLELLDDHEDELPEGWL